MILIRFILEIEILKKQYSLSWVIEMQYIRSINKQNHFKAKQPGRCAKKWYILTFLSLFGISLNTSSRFEIKIFQFLLNFTGFFFLAISCWNLTVKQLFNVGDSWFINSRIEAVLVSHFHYFFKKIIKFMERNNDILFKKYNATLSFITM